MEFLDRKGNKINVDVFNGDFDAPYDPHHNGAIVQQCDRVGKSQSRHQLALSSVLLRAQTIKINQTVLTDLCAFSIVSI